MMTEDDYKHFVCVVASDNPDLLMDEYDKNKNVEKQVVFKYKDADKIRKSYISEYEKILLNKEITKSEREYIELALDDIKDMSPEDFYYDLITTSNYEVDEDTGDAVYFSNKQGKLSYYQIGKLFSIPFLLKDGRETFQAKKKDIDWERIHMAGGDVYKRAWEMVMDGSKPTNDIEEQIFENMKDKTTYFQKFETKENYVTSNTAFWGYAFLSEKTGWIDADDCEDQFVWMSKFYDTFIKNLDDETILTIYECKK